MAHSMSYSCMTAIISCRRIISGANARGISTSPIINKFWEKDEKSGYRKETPKTVKGEFQFVRSGLKQLKEELNIFKNEVKSKILDDPPLFMQEGTMDIIWKFNSKNTLDTWVITSDRDHGQGSSECNVDINENKKGHFYGVLRTDIPKDGRAKRAGYCNMRSMRPRKSFKRDSYHDWTLFTHLVLRVRGDGRSYMINLATAGEWDILWNDLYSFPLYTRGGPYWQVTKIPFSKFFLSSKGRVQDKQTPVPSNRITSVGISCGDAIDGTFSLEIDYIGIEYDPSHTEEFAYEMYQIPKFIADV